MHELDEEATRTFRIWNELAFHELFWTCKYVKSKLKYLHFYQCLSGFNSEYDSSQLGEEHRCSGDATFISRRSHLLTNLGKYIELYQQSIFVYHWSYSVFLNEIKWLETHGGLTIIECFEKLHKIINMCVFYWGHHAKLIMWFLKSFSRP